MADVVAIACAALVVSPIQQAVGERRPGAIAVTTTLVVFPFLVGMTVSGAYSGPTKGLVSSQPFDVHRIWRGMLLGGLLALQVDRMPMAAGGEELQVEQVLLVGLLASVAIPAARRVTSVLVLPRGNSRRVLILGSGRVATSIAGRLRRCSNLVVVGMVDDDPRDPSQVLGSEAELREICLRHEVDAVVVAFSRKPMHETLEVLRGVSAEVSVWVVPRLYELVSWRSAVDDLHGMPLLDVAPAQRGRAARAVKRGFDLVVAVALLVILSPVFAVVAVAIKATSPGPVMFRQFRSGQHRRPFRIYKFRTMEVDAEQRLAALTRHNEVDGPIFKMRNDPRVTWVGEWLRKTSLDELPQLINVLRGDMSLVGPRPFPIEESERIDGAAGFRFSVPPGMTGLWQVSGRSALTYDDLRHLDYIYAASWSLLWDLRILLQTPASVLHRRGVL